MSESTIINIDFRSHIEIETKLSNFNEYHFTIDGVHCRSFEGWIQSVKTPDTEEQVRICGLHGKTAKRVSRTLPDWKNNQQLYWNGETYKRSDPKYIELVTRAYGLLFEQSDTFRELLLSTGHAKLTHKVGSSSKTQSVLTEREFCDILTNLRDTHLYGDDMVF